MEWSQFTEREDGERKGEQKGFRNPGMETKKNFRFLKACHIFVVIKVAHKGTQGKCNVN